MKLQQWLQLRQAQKEEAKLVVLCPTCNEPFNAKWQTGICPHVSIGEFVYLEQTKKLRREEQRLAGFGRFGPWQA